MLQAFRPRWLVPSVPRRPRVVGRLGLLGLVGLLGLGLLGLGGCGEKGTDARATPLVEVVASPLDGEPPTEGLSVVRLERSGQRESYALTPAAGRPHVYEARGAPEGNYLLRVQQGWGMLNVPQLPALQHDGRVTRIRVGRLHSFYLTSTDAERRLGETWALLRVTPEAERGALVPLSVQQEPRSFTILRVPPTEWRGALVLQGRFADGGLCEHVPISPGEQGLPIFRMFGPEPLAPLRVSVVGGDAPGAQAAPAEVWMRARVRGLPLVEEQQAPVRDGVAWFRGLPTTGTSLEVEPVERAEPGRLVFPAGGWGREGELRVHLAPRGARPVDVDLPEGPAVEQVQVCGAEATSFGLVPHQVEAGRLRLHLGPGAWRLLLLRGGQFTFGSFRLAEQGEPTQVAWEPAQSAASVRGSVSGGQGGRLLFEREESGRRVLGHGFVAALGSLGSYEAKLPPGDYRLTVEGPRGARDDSRRFTLAPGELRSLALDAPR